MTASAISGVAGEMPLITIINFPIRC